MATLLSICLLVSQVNRFLEQKTENRRRQWMCYTSLCLEFCKRTKVYYNTANMRWFRFTYFGLMVMFMGGGLVSIILILKYVFCGFCFICRFFCFSRLDFAADGIFRSINSRMFSTLISFKMYTKMGPSLVILPTYFRMFALRSSKTEWKIQTVNFKVPRFIQFQQFSVKYCFF